MFTAPVYYPCTALMRILLIGLARWQVSGKENVCAKGPLIVVSNHLHAVDPLLLGASIPRRIAFMAKDELFRNRLGASLVRSFGAFPVRRNQLDRQALSQANAVLKKGLALGIFPEGERSRSS
ncbi:MAG: lysophospholipid acyltransferase family protein, partial [Dehalococcoidia bacterium]